MALSKRILSALEVLDGGGGSGRGTLKDQAGEYLNAPVDDDAIRYCVAAAEASFDTTYGTLLEQTNEALAMKVALATVFIAGMGVGKRLGIEDGEELAKLVKT